MIRQTVPNGNTSRIVSIRFRSQGETCPVRQSIVNKIGTPDGKFLERPGTQGWTWTFARDDDDDDDDDPASSLTGKFDGVWRGINWSMNFYWDLDLEEILDRRWIDWIDLVSKATRKVKTFNFYIIFLVDRYQNYSSSNFWASLNQ